MIRYLHSTRSNNPIYFLDSFGIYKLNANSNQLEQSTKKVKKKNTNHFSRRRRKRPHQRVSCRDVMQHDGVTSLVTWRDVMAKGCVTFICTSMFLPHKKMTNKNIDYLHLKDFLNNMNCTWSRHWHHPNNKSLLLMAPQIIDFPLKLHSVRLSLSLEMIDDAAFALKM